jgi:drug/metabolite transporter (DMT)-like permease
MNQLDILSLLLVGALWGCTNPLLRKGATEISSNKDANSNDQNGILRSLRNFQHFRVWVPYLLNQSGSVVYYFLLAHSDLTSSVPIANALALVFSIWTSYFLGERVNRPFLAVLGSGLVMAGTVTCMIAKQKVSDIQQ